MNTSRKARTAIAGVAFAIAGIGAAQAQDAPVRPATHHAHLIRTSAPPLTVHRHLAPVVSGEPIVAADGMYDGAGIFRRWDDTRLYSFYGWRLGGDNFYGDTDGSPITRGNAGLGMIAGYGAARGGYGGPHFDSVGGFHNGPGPEAQEDDDYATGSIYQPRYDRPQPAYASLKQQVAQLDTGLAGTGQVSRVKSSRERWAEAYREGSLPGHEFRDAPEPEGFGAFGSGF